MSQTDAKELFPDLVLIFFAMLILMFLFEVTKQVIYPQILPWESHVVTIVFTSILAVVILYFPLHASYRARQDMDRALTAREKSEEKLRQSEIQYRSFVESVEDSIYTVDRDCRYLLINSRHVARKGLTQDSYAGKQYRDFHSPAESQVFEAQVQQVLTTRALVQAEYERNGRYFLRKLNPVIDPATSEVIAVTVVSSDITGQKQTEHALAQANKKLTLLSGITRHDIKNQLLALTGYLQLSRDSLADPVRTAEYLSKEEKIADTICHQITFTKEYENLGIKAPAWQGVASLVDAVIMQLPVRDIRVDKGDADLEILADPLLETVFYNLIENALRYGGEKMTAIRVSSQKKDGMLVLICEDDGTGIAAEEKEKIFARGFGKNTGLGLFLVREILSLTGITIKETGTFGCGARFEMTVPEGAFRFTGTQ